jgi:hypothetical protein
VVSYSLSFQGVQIVDGCQSIENDKRYKSWENNGLLLFSFMY